MSERVDPLHPDALTAVVLAALADAARLNWLEENGDMGNVRGTSYLKFTVEFDEEQNGEPPTLREAIDAARGSVPSPTPNTEGAT